MACKIHLTPLNAGGSPEGRWFLTEAPVGFDGTLSISCNNVSFTTISGLPSDVTPLDNACTDKHDIWVNLDGEAVGTYVFTFVSPLENTAEDCAVDCVDCATFTVDAEEIVPEDEVTYCNADPDVYNVFTLMFIDPLDYSIDDVTGCVFEDPDCIAANGNFVPEDMGEGVYVVTFTRNDALGDCDDCTTSLTITIGAAGDAGDDQNGVACITVD